MYFRTAYQITLLFINKSDILLNVRGHYTPTTKRYALLSNVYSQRNISVYVGL